MFVDSTGKDIINRKIIVSQMLHIKVQVEDVQYLLALVMIIRTLETLRLLRGKATGALTYSFVQTLEQEPRLSYGRLLMVMYNRIDGARQQVSLNSTASQILSS